MLNGIFSSVYGSSLTFGAFCITTLVSLTLGALLAFAYSREKHSSGSLTRSLLVLPKGATGIGEVKKVVQPGIFGKDGRIDIDFTCIYGVDGTKIPVTVGELAKQKAESIAGAAGALPYWTGSCGSRCRKTWTIWTCFPTCLRILPPRPG